MYQDNGNKTFLFLRRDVPVPILLNAIGHALIGLMVKFGGFLERIDPLQYLNADGGEHIVSRYPVIVLGVKNSGQIARLRRELAPLVADGTVIYNDFARQMIGASAEEQMGSTTSAPYALAPPICSATRRSASRYSRRARRRKEDRMLATSPDVITSQFEEWARTYVNNAAETWRRGDAADAFHINRDSAWKRVLNEHLSMSPAAFFATEPEEPRYRAAFHAALSDAVIAQADTIAATGDDVNVNAYDVIMKTAVTRLIARADGFDDATIAALRVLRRRDSNGPFSLLGLP